MDALTLSPYIIAKSNLAGDGITNKKLQKLLYYVKAWGLVYFEDGGSGCWRRWDSSLKENNGE